MKLIEVLAALPKLKQGELAKVRAAAEHLMNKKEEQTDADTQLLYDAMQRCLSSRIPWHNFVATTSYKEWCKYAPVVIAFGAETFTVKSRVALLGIYTVLVSMVVKDLRARKVPVTVGSLVSNIGRIPELFENDFPDYKASGLTHLILRQMEKGK